MFCEKATKGIMCNTRTGARKKSRLKEPPGDHDDMTLNPDQQVQRRFIYDHSPWFFRFPDHGTPLDRCSLWSTAVVVASDTVPAAASRSHDHNAEMQDQDWHYIAPHRIRTEELRVAVPACTRWPERESLNLQRLARVLEFQGCVAFLGAGASSEKKYPQWAELLPRPEAFRKTFPNRKLPEGYEGLRELVANKKSAPHIPRLVRPAKPDEISSPNGR